MNYDPTLSIIVVSWNTRDLLRLCIHSALDSLTGMNGEVIVVDNASTDGSAAMVQEEFSHEPRVRLMANTENLGFAAGNNQALAAASGNIIAIVNPDIVLNRATLAAMLEYLLAHGRVGLVSCNLVGSNGKSQSIHRRFPTIPIIFFEWARVGKHIDRWLLRNRFHRHYRLQDMSRKDVKIIDQAAGACMMMRRATIEKIGVLFDERFPILGNDLDLCRRIWNADLEVHVLFNVSVTHYGSASLEQVDGTLKESWLWEALKVYYDLHEPQWKRWALRRLIPRK
ncbi:glycosyltransferase family 2 protein [candidate division KSB1 bacterium]|nr:MAG: glycosyltransferase family 2 protein [candidate division KSB1 bacterium]MBC6946594.1 glycosyltransferase family 2 protein [candidate division KSB1 bacterium]MCE7940189.1 glycosyltransferase family 2 protein [Chlorobi bacterium CHB1]MDL1873858.1 glycosyltransferase family 2 protein [Cytophagia bacterium CHB2]